jgi:hypothetical protein
MYCLVVFSGMACKEWNEKNWTNVIYNKKIQLTEKKRS